MIHVGKVNGLARRRLHGGGQPLDLRTILRAGQRHESRAQITEHIGGEFHLNRRS